MNSIKFRHWPRRLTGEELARPFDDEPHPSLIQRIIVRLRTVLKGSGSAAAAPLTVVDNTKTTRKADILDATMMGPWLEVEDETFHWPPFHADSPAVVDDCCEGCTKHESCRKERADKQGMDEYVRTLMDTQSPWAASRHLGSARPYMVVDPAWIKDRMYQTHVSVEVHACGVVAGSVLISMDEVLNCLAYAERCPSAASGGET